MFIGLLDRQCRFEEDGHAAEESGNLAWIDGNETVAGNIKAVIYRILHDQDLLRCGVFAAVAFDGNSITEGLSQKRHCFTCFASAWYSAQVNPAFKRIFSLITR